MGGRFGKYGDLKRKVSIRRSRRAKLNIGRPKRKQKESFTYGK